MSELTPCPECHRHVRKTEARCPFCGEAVSLTHVPSPVLPRKRLGRAATFAFGASVVGATALVACGDDDPGDIATHYGAPPMGGSNFAGGRAAYGAPPSGSSTGGNHNGDAGAGTAVYGAPAAGTGGEEPGGTGGAAGAGGVAEAGGAAGPVSEGGNSTSAVYGAPPSGAGGD